MTLFSAYFQPAQAARIWDVYFAEGRKTAFRISLAIMKINEKTMLSSSMMEMK
jgi:hypothetical protein